MKKFPHDRTALLHIKNPLYRKFLHEFFCWQLAQDGSDVTTAFLLKNKNEAGVAKIIAKASGTLAGQMEVDFFLNEFVLAKKIKFHWRKKDGEKFQAGEVLLEISGFGSFLLKAERVLLNVLSRMSGIATLTKKIAELLPPEVSIAATRKTLWGLLDKKAVALGGGLTHRLGLFDSVLVKENHLAFLKSGAAEAAQKIQETMRKNPKNLGAFWEIEVETEADFFAVLGVLGSQKNSVPGVIMLDNFSPPEIRKIFRKISKAEYHRRNVSFEISGGIRPENIRKFAVSGVDVLSCGFLTNSAPPLDLSMRIVPAC